MEIKKSDGINLVILILYKIMLEIIYIKIIVPIFGYSGFENNLESKYYFFYWIIFFLFSIPIIKLYKNKKPSSFVILIFMMVGFIPGIVIQSFMPQSKMYIFLFLIYWFLLIFYNNVIPNIKINIKFNDKIPVYIVTTFLCITVIYISGKYANFRMNFDLLNVYDLRDLSREFNMPTSLTYLFSAAKTCIPILFVYFIQNKQKAVATCLAFIQFLAFSVDGSKSTFFSLLITYLLYKFVKKITIHRISYVLTSIVGLTFIEYFILKTNYIVLFFIRRVMFLPNMLHFYYYDFFSNNVKDYFKQGLIGRFGATSSYDTAIPNIIGFNFSGSTTMIANNGLFSDAYYNLGVLGIFLLPLMLIIVLKFFDSCSEGIDIKILIAAIVTVSYTFISSSFFTVLLTHGFLLTCFVLLVIPKKEALGYE